jgi:hypothetical protein
VLSVGQSKSRANRHRAPAPTAAAASAAAVNARNILEHWIKTASGEARFVAIEHASIINRDDTQALTALGGVQVKSQRTRLMKLFWVCPERAGFAVARFEFSRPAKV